LWRLGIGEGQTPQRLPFVGEDGIMPVVSRPQPGQPARLAYIRSFADSNIWRLDLSAPGAAATSPPVIAISSTRRDAIAALTPDGQRVVFVSDRSGEHEMWVAGADGNNPMQLTTMKADPGFGRFSPDGKLVAFHSNPEGQGDIFVVPAGGGRPRNLTSHPANDSFPSFSRDGQWIYFSSTRTGQPLLWKVPVAGGAAVQVSDSPGLLAVESVDGAHLYYVSATTTDRPGPLVRQSSKGGDVVRLFDGVVSTSFDVIERGIYYLERVPGETRLVYFDFAARQSAVIAENLGAVGFGLSAASDGRAIFFARVDSAVDNLMLVEGFR
jgi:Tol biopolymer transport system component